MYVLCEVIELHPLVADDARRQGVLVHEGSCKHTSTPTAHNRHHNCRHHHINIVIIFTILISFCCIVSILLTVCSIFPSWSSNQDICRELEREIKMIHVLSICSRCLFSAFALFC